MSFRSAAQAEDCANLHLGRGYAHRPDTLMQTAKSQIAETACRRGGPYIFGSDRYCPFKNDELLPEIDDLGIALCR
jgi:hypothetical protein